MVLALVALFLVVAGTGLYQAFRYRPDAQSAWPALKTTSVSRDALYDTTEFVHRWGAYLFVALVVATAVLWAWTRAKRARSAWGTEVALAVVGVAAIGCVVTGPKLRWDQLALWAVTVGSDFPNLFELAQVKFVLIGSKEIAVDDFRRMVWTHTAILPAILAVALGVAWWRSSRATRKPQR
jgi:quinol-cytochrome oxidoreductase complex cytochrome b subunit